MLSRDVYREPFRRWNELSWIRAGALRSGALRGLMFSPDLVPLSTHREIVSDPLIQQRLLAYRLITHLHFTTVLELEHVNIVCSDLAQGRGPVRLDAAKRNDALKIYCDEGGHALFVELLLRQVEEHFTLSREVLGRPNFDRVLATIVAGSPLPEQITQLLFVCVSETLVSKTLCEMPEDERVCSLVREVIADHADDESRHSTYFQWLFPLIWSHVSHRHGGEVGGMLAEFLIAFLGPDLECERRILHELGFAPRLAADMLNEVYSTTSLTAAINEAARPTLRMFSKVGLFEIPEVAETFTRRGLSLEE